VEFSSRSEAVRREKLLKRQKGGGGLKKLLGKNLKLRGSSMVEQLPPKADQPPAETVIII